ncbi:MAG: DUF4124 domain-containing protein [Gammaproteobacteria bacterium]|nr:DUF4124 domain-containing protein [Gammaproteobacteria bacterium]MBU1414579.1 DUF4124 domain-containing protein [Gammaproteobacteria bacterium]
MTRITLLVLVLAALPACVQAEVYRWVDEKGKVHYGDRPIAKDVKRVRGLLEPKAPDTLPKPGMKADEVRAAYGEPERIRTVSTKDGETEIWVFRQSKRVKQDFSVKIEGGEVVEVATDTASVASQGSAATGIRASSRSPAEVEEQRQRAMAQQQEMAQQQAEQKERRCASLRENVQRIVDQERRGGSASSMDSLREQKRRASERLSSEGCGF